MIYDTHIDLVVVTQYTQVVSSKTRMHCHLGEGAMSFDDDEPVGTVAIDAVRMDIICTIHDKTHSNHITSIDDSYGLVTQETRKMGRLTIDSN